MNAIPALIITLFLLVSNKKEIKKNMLDQQRANNEIVNSSDTLSNGFNSSLISKDCELSKSYLNSINDLVLIKYIEKSFYKNQAYFDTTDIGSLDPFVINQYRTICNSALYVNRLGKDTLDRCKLALNFYNLYDSLNQEEVILTKKFNEIAVQLKINNLKAFDKFKFNKNWKLENRRENTIELYQNYKQLYLGIKLEFSLLKRKKQFVKTSQKDLDDYNNSIKNLREKYSKYPWLLGVLNEYEKNPDTFDENNY